MTEIIHDGLRLVPSREAARRFNITNDYIGRLCKTNKVSGSLISGSWYVNEDSLRDFLLKTNREKYERRDALREERAHAYREAQARLLGDSIPAKRAVGDEKKISLHHGPLRIHAAPRRVPKSFTIFAQRGLAVMFAVVVIVGGIRFSDAEVFRVARETLPAAAVLAGLSNLSEAGAYSSLSDRLRFDRSNEAYWIWYEMNGATIDQPISGLAEEEPSIIGRIVDAVTPGSISEALLNARLAALESRLLALISLVPPTNSVAPVYHYYIDNTSGVGGGGFDDIDITNSTYTGGTITGATITGGSVTATSFDGVLPAVNGGTGTSTYAVGDILYADSPATLGRLAQGSNGQVLKVVGGDLVWSTDISGGGGSGAFATTSDDLAIYVADTSDVVIIGSNATSTTGNILEIAGNTLIRGVLTAYNTITAPAFNATSTTATSTFAMLNITGSLGIGADYITDISGDGLTMQSGALSLDDSGDWGGTFDGLEGSYYLANSFSTTSASYFISQQNLGGFSTTSADYWKTQRDFFATTSSEYWKSVSNFFSTTSAEYFLSQNQEEAFSTTSAAYFLSQQSLGGFSTTSADFWQTQRNFFSTTSTDYWKSVNNFFSTTSADFWKTANNFFSTTSADAWKDQRNFFSTTSASYFLAQNQGNAFSTTSANYWETQQTPRTADDLSNNSIEDLSDVTAMTENYGDLLYWNGSAWADIATSSLGLVQFGDLSSSLSNYLSLASWYATTTDGLAQGTTNRYYDDGLVQDYLNTVTKGFFFSTTSADAWKDQRNFFSTTSAAYFSSVGLAFSTTSNDFWATQRNFFSTTSSSYFLSQNQGAAFSTTSANYLIHSSTTVPKLYSANTWTGGNIFGNATTSYATTTSLFVTDTFAGAGLGACNASSDKLVYNAVTKKFECGSDAGAGGGITSLRAEYSSAQTDSAQVFATSSDTNIGLTITSAGGTHTFTPVWSGVLSVARGGTGIASTPNYGELLVGDGLGGYVLAATSSLGLSASSFSTTSADYWQSQRNFFSTTSAQYFTHSSTTIPKTYTSNTFTALQNFANASSTLFSASYASTTNLFANTASTSNLTISALQNGLLKVNASGVVSLAVAGTDYANFAYLFPNNATSTLLAFNGGLTAYASSTIGGGTQASGLTIKGGATTTGNAYIAGSLGVGTNSNLNGAITANGTFGVQAEGDIFRQYDSGDAQWYPIIARYNTANGSFPASTYIFGNGTNAKVAFEVPGGGNLTTFQVRANTATFNGALTAGNATTTQLGISGIPSALLATDANGTVYATTSLSSSFLNTSGNWTGTFDGQEGSYYLANSFSTTSADAWKLTRDFFSTTSANYFVSSSTTIPKTYTNNTFTGTNAFNAITLGSLNGPLQANNGVISATSSILAIYGGTGQTTYTVGDILYASAAGTLSKLPIGGSGTVLKVAGGVPTWGADITTGGGGGSTAWSTTTDSLAVYPTDTSNVILVGTNATTTANSIFEVSGQSYFSGNVGIGVAPTTKLEVNGVASSSGLVVSTLSGLLKANGTSAVTAAVAGIDYVANTSGDWTGTFDGQEGSFYLANSFSSSSADYWKTQRDFFSTTSASYFSSIGLAWSTTSANYYLSQNGALGFSTTSNDYWMTQRNFFSTTSANYWSSLGLGFSTSSADAWKDQRNFFSTTSASYFLSQNQGAAFSTTSANYWESQQTPRTADDLSDNSIEDLSDVTAMTENYGDLLYWNGSAWADIATSSLGLVQFGDLSSSLSNYLSLAAWYATTTDGLDEGSTNRYYNDTLVQDYLNTVTKGFFFSTTSADAWKDQRNFFSTTSAAYFSSVGLAWSTTSANYFLSQNQGAAFSTTSANYFAHSSTTIPKTYTANVFTSLQSFSNASSTLFSSSYASSTIANFGTICLSGDTCRTSWPTGSAYPFFGTGNSTSTLVQFNGGLTAYASSTIGAGGQATGLTISGGATTTGNQYIGGVLTMGALSNVVLDPTSVTGSLAINFGSTELRLDNSQFYVLGAGEMNFDSTDGDFFISGTQNDLVFDGDNTSGYVFEINNFLRVAADGNGTTTLSGLDINGSATSTSNVGFNISAGCYAVNGVCLTQGITSTAGDWTGTFDGQEGSYYLANSFSTTSASYFASIGLAFSTTSADAWKDQRNFFSTTSAQYFAHSSTTIPKTYTSNTFTALQNFANASSTLFSASYASTTNLFANTASTSNLTISALQNGLLKVNASGVVSLAVAGTDYQNFAYLFPNNATSTLLNFNGGLTAYASSTIGNGTQTGGLTINGGATTTGNAYFAGNVSTAMIRDGSNLSAVDVANRRLLSTGTVNALDFSSASSIKLSQYTTNGFLTASGGNGTLTVDTTLSTSGGNVGVGTSSPYAKLSVAGEVVGANFTATTTTVNTFPTLLSTNASTTNLGITGLPSALLATDANGRVYATTSISSGLLNTTGNWTGTFDGQEGSYYLANSFSTTSADYWQTQRNFFSTTSANYWKSVNDFFSTTSAIYFAHSSTTIPKTYTANAFTALQSFSNASSTLFSSSYASSTALYAGAFTLGSLNGPLQANNGLVSATTSIGVLYGGTGLTSAPTFGQILVGNSSGGYTLTATSSLGLPTFAYPFPSGATTTALSFGNITATNATTSTLFSGILSSNIARFGQTATSSFASNGALTLATALTVPNGGTGATSFTSGSLVYGSGTGALQSVATTTATIGGSLSYSGTFGALVGGSAGTLSLNMGNANTWTALQSFANASSTLLSSSYASTTNLFAYNASTSNLTISSVSNALLKTNASGQVAAAVLGTDYQNFTYPFSLTGNATSTLTQFNGGLTAYASSTIGNGAQGLTVSGNSTTTGTAYFAGNVGIGTATPGETLEINDSGFTTIRIRETSSGNILDFGSGVASHYFGGYGMIPLTFGTNGLERMRIDASGNLGIGTSSPYAKLSVVGDVVAARFVATTTATSTFAGPLAITSSGTSTFANGIQISAGCFRDVNGNCIGNQDLSAYVDGAGNGSTNRVAYWSDNNTLTSDADFSFDGTTVTMRDLLISHTAPILSINDSGSTGTDFRIDVLAGSATFNADIANALSSEFFAWATNADEKMRLSEDGNLAIGNTSAGTAKLEVTNTTALASFLVEDSAAGDSSPFIIDTDGNVGIGNPTPSAPLTVMKAGYDQLLDGSMMVLGSFSDATQDKGVILGYNSADDLGVIAAHTDGSNNGLSFMTYNSGWGERARLTASGRFGLGTTSPGSLLSIGDTQGINFSTATSTFSSSGGINISGGCFAINGVCVGGSSGSSFAFPFTSGTNFGASTNSTTTNLSLFGGLNASSTVRFGNAGQPMFLFNGSNGRLGLGTSTPGAMLSIAGDTLGNKFTGAYFVATSSIASRFPYASTTAITATTASTTNLVISGLQNGLLKVNASGVVSLAVAGTDYSNFAYPFPSNATSTTLRFNNGLLSTASSTFTASTYFPNGVWGADGSVNIGQTSGFNMFTVRNSGMSPYPLVVLPSSGNGSGAFVDLGGEMAIWLADSAATNRVEFRTNGPSYLTGGNVGIGTTTPYSNLSVWGGTMGTIFEAVTSASTTALSISATGNATTTLRGLNIAGVATSTSNVGFNITAGCYAINGTCISTGGSSFAYPFSLTGNATSTLTQFNGGLTAYASTTIGAGGQGTGLTVSGGATTTGNLNVRGGLLRVGSDTQAQVFGYSEGVSSFDLYADAAASYLYLNDAGGRDINLSTVGNSYFNTSGNLGVGSTTPGSLLSIGNTNGINFSTATSTFSSTGGINLSSGCYAINGTCISGGSSGANDFTFASNFAATNAATSSILWAQNGINASSTSRFAEVTFFEPITFAASTTATSTLARINGSSGMIPFITASTSISQTSFGYGAGAKLGTVGVGLFQAGNVNTAFGSLALTSATSSWGNTAFGSGALTSDVNNGALQGLNTAIGVNALASNTYGDNNVGLGYTALFLNTLGSNNVALGYAAGGSITSGTGNILVGPSVTANNLTTGSGNIGIGYNTFFPSATANYQLNIGGLIFGNLPATSTSLVTNPEGRIGIGTTTPAFARLTIASSTEAQLSLSTGAGIAQWAFRNAGGNLYFSTTTAQGIATTTISALEISGSGFGTTTVRGLNISGFATSTSNVGFNITAGCYAINGTCVSGGSGSTFAYPFSLTGNATSTLTQFNGGLTAYASSTIGNGTLGLTVNGPTNMTGLLSISTTGANPSIYNPTAGNGLIMRGDTNGAQLRIVSNPNAWTGGATTTSYFQITNAQNDNVSFMGGTYGADRIMNRLQFNASSSQFTDTDYEDTPIPESILEAISSTARKIGLKVRGATAQTAEFFSVQDVSGNRLLNVAASGSVGIGTTTPWASLSVHSTAGMPQFVIGSTTATQFIVDQSGFVGIGTTTPTEKLTVQGNIKINDNVISPDSVTLDAETAIGLRITNPNGYVSVTPLNTSGAHIYTSLPRFYFNVTPTSIGGAFSAYSTADLKLQTGSGGATRMTIQASTGNVGIATTSPWANLSLHSSAGSPQFVIGSSTTQFIVDKSGFVGIGTTTPMGMLSITNVGTDRSFIVEDEANDASPFVITSTGNVGIGTAAPAGTFSVHGNAFLDSDGTTDRILYFRNQDTVGTVQSDAALRFSAGNTERMRILSTGNVGIGTSTPSTALEVAGYVTLGSTNTDQYSLKFTGVGTNSYYIGKRSANSSSALGMVYGSGPANDNGLFLDQSGRVGIATSSPWGKLSINPIAGDTGPAFVIGSSTANMFSVTRSGVGSIFNFGMNSTSTVPNNTRYAWTIATSSTASPLFRIDTTSGAETVTLGALGSDVYIGDVGSPSDLVFEESSTIMGSGSGKTLTFGANSDIINFGVNVGIGTTTPDYKLTVDNGATSAYPLNLTSSSKYVRIGALNGTYAHMDTDATSGFYFYDAIRVAAANHLLSLSSADSYLASAGGNVGIGTTTPQRLLTLFDNTAPQLSLSAGAGVAQWTFRNAGGNLYFSTTTVAGTATTTLPAFLINGTTGRVGIGTSTPNSKLTVHSNVTGATSSALTTFVASFVNTSNSTTGHGIGIVAGSNSTAGSAMIQFYRPDGTNLGGIRQNAAGTVQYNTGSDRRIKENIASSTIGLADLMRIPVLEFSYISDPTHARATGFMAQDLHTVFPDAVGTNGDNGLTTLSSTSTPWAVDYGRVTPLIVKAIQDLNNFVFGNRTATSSIATSTLTQIVSSTSTPLEGRVQDMASALDTIASSTATTSTATGEKTFLGRMFARMAQWFADAANGIGEFFAGRIHTKEICVGESGNETCITKAQLDALLSNSGNSGGSQPSPAPAPAPTPEPEPEPETEGESASSTPSVVEGGDEEPVTDEEAPVVEAPSEPTATESPPAPVSESSDDGEDAS